MAGEKSQEHEHEHGLLHGLRERVHHATDHLQQHHADHVDHKAARKERDVESEIARHNQDETHRYMVHFPPHPARTDDPHYKDFDAYHRKTRATARCFIGERVGFHDCRDEKGKACPPPAEGQQDGLELHHAHVEFSLQNGISLKALEKDYPGISNKDQVGDWVESEANFRWLCVFHHRGAGGAHTASHSDWEASQYVLGLIAAEPGKTETAKDEDADAPAKKAAPAKAKTESAKK